MTLKQARKERGWTQVDLAALVGIHSVTLCLIENYKAVPQLKTKKRLQKIFGDELEFLPASEVVRVVERFIGTNADTASQRGQFLKEHIDKVIECIELDIMNLKQEQP